MVSAIVAVGRDGGHPAEAVRLLSGAVWLSPAHVGRLTLLDGWAEEVAAQVQVALYRETIDAVHVRTTGYVVKRGDQPVEQFQDPQKSAAVQLHRTVGRSGSWLSSAPPRGSKNVILTATATSEAR